MPCSLIEFNPPILAAPLWGRSVITSVMTAPAHGWAYYTRTRLLHRICSYCHWCLGICYFAFPKIFAWLLILHPGIFVFELQLSTCSIPSSKKINVTSLPYLFLNKTVPFFFTFTSFYKLSTAQKRRPTLLSLHRYPRIKPEFQSQSSWAQQGLVFSQT